MQTLTERELAEVKPGDVLQVERRNVYTLTVTKVTEHLIKTGGGTFWKTGDFAGYGQGYARQNIWEHRRIVGVEAQTEGVR